MSCLGWNSTRSTTPLQHARRGRQTGAGQRGKGAPGQQAENREQEGRPGTGNELWAAEGEERCVCPKLTGRSAGGWAALVPRGVRRAGGCRTRPRQQGRGPARPAPSLPAWGLAACARAARCCCMAMLRAPLHGGEGDLQIPCAPNAKQLCRQLLRHAQLQPSDIRTREAGKSLKSPQHHSASPQDPYLWPVKECVQKPPSTSHTRTVRSAEPVASSPPDASTAMSATGALCPLKLRSACPLSSDQQRSCRLRDAVNNWRALGLRASAVRGSESCRQQSSVAAGFGQAGTDYRSVAVHTLIIAACIGSAGRQPAQAPQGDAACMVGCRDAPRAASAARRRSMDPPAWPHRRRRTPATVHRAIVAQGRRYKILLVSGALYMIVWVLSWLN